MFSKYKSHAPLQLSSADTDQAEYAELKGLAVRAGEHLKRVIVVTHRENEGWVAAFSSMNSKDWPSIFDMDEPCSFTDMSSALRSVIERFEPKGEVAAEDREVRLKAEQYREYMNADFAFVAYRESGYVVTLRYDRLDEDLDGKPYPEIIEMLAAQVPVDFPESEDAYLGRGRDYGG